MPEHANVYAALIAAQKAIGPIVKDNTATVPNKDPSKQGFRYNYADLGSVIGAIQGPLQDNGLALFQPLSMTPDGQPTVRTVIVYAPTGEKIESEAPLVCKDPTNPQAVGGAITYFRRYSLLALLGLAPEDDDGQAASQAPKERRQQTEAKPAGNGHHEAPPPQSAEITSWTAVWKRLREDLKIATAEDFGKLTGHKIESLSPQEAIDLAKSCLADVAASHAE